MNTRNQFGSIPRHSGQRGQDTSRHWSETFESKSKFHSDIVGLSIGTPHLPATPLDIVLSQKYLKTGLTGRRRRGTRKWEELVATGVPKIWKDGRKGQEPLLGPSLGQQGPGLTQNRFRSHLLHTFFLLSISESG
uniref:Uncharacterized protein n=1 Tax=Vespula pensylvanica TaxID=30213 RepID=A0A834NRF0_VESPE|nr:hypothetical protein H0235_011122 [Vespula pensylvanica]